MASERRPRVGDWVEVRPLWEIMATLDQSCALEAMPFMPEMAQYAGRRYQIVKSAHKTCDPMGTSDLRRMSDAVHLETRCDGGAHDGCEARCLLFWKGAWLRPVDGPAISEKPSYPAQDADCGGLQAGTRRRTDAGELRYRCQATEIVAATRPLPISDLRQYLEDVSSGNVSLVQFFVEMVRAYANAVIRKAAKSIQIGGRRLRAPTPPVATATGDAKNLELQPGEFVQIRSADEILASLDENQKNRGLLFEREMLRHCGKTYRVLAKVARIIDEKSGKMIKLRNDCFSLEGVSCRGLDKVRRIFCPRAPFFYWREAWLRRANDLPGGAAK
jgi:hypothetical protein